MTYIALHLKSKTESITDFEKEFKTEIDEITEQFEILTKHEAEFNRLKNAGLYVTFHNNDFNLPDNTITTSQFLIIKKIATMSLGVVEKIIDFAESKGGFSKLRHLYKEGSNSE